MFIFFRFFHPILCLWKSSRSFSLMFCIFTGVPLWRCLSIYPDLGSQVFLCICRLVPFISSSYFLAILSLNIPFPHISSPDTSASHMWNILSLSYKILDYSIHIFNLFFYLCCVLENFFWLTSQFTNFFVHLYLNAIKPIYENFDYNYCIFPF